MSMRMEPKQPGMGQPEPSTQHSQTPDTEKFGEDQGKDG